MVDGVLNEVVVTAQVANGKDLKETLYVDFARAPAPVNVVEQRRFDNNERVLAELRAHMLAVRENRVETAMTVEIEMTRAEIKEMRAYCDAVEDPNATRIIPVQLERCREFRADYPIGEYPL